VSPPSDFRVLKKLSAYLKMSENRTQNLLQNSGTDFIAKEM